VRNVLNGNLKVWHLVVVAAAMLLFTGASVALANPDAVNVLFPKGDVYMVSASNKGDNLTTPNNGDKLEVLSVSFDVPVGKRGDVQAVFSGFLQHNVGTFSYCFGEFRFDSATGKPLQPNTDGGYQLYGGATSKLPDQITGTFTGHRKGLKPGHYVLKAYLYSAYATCNVYQRNMNVLVNLR
jgi:hypothetical protein